MISTFRKHDTVFYRPRNGRSADVIRARVETRHRDGTVTIRALFAIDPATGTDRNGLLDYKYRVGPDGLHHDATAA